ncbi:MAG TPA: V-type ATPase 116kDa subunit family protein [Candidatus Dormibacteraeota bacterium]|nr:V-type ATPase 116kDa subunit family protein [Candidatus Dormibacteraeota bacterium]
MARIAIVTRLAAFRDALVIAAATGWIQLEQVESDEGEDAEALRRLHAAGIREVAPLLARSATGAADLERTQRADLLAGEVELERRSRAAVFHGDFAVAVGWMPSDRVQEVKKRLAAAAADLVELPCPPNVDPPTLLRRPRAGDSFRPLVETYGTVRYADLDPTAFTAVSFVLMFGMMFADVGHGLLLALAGVLIRLLPHPRLASLRRYWLLPTAAGLVAAGFGAAYGEAFGPTGLVPALWLQPLQDPVRLLVVGVIVGSVLLAVSYLIGTVNRWRESGPWAAAYSSSGLAGLVTFLAVGGMVAAVYWDIRPLLVVSLAAFAFGLLMIFIGLWGEAGGGSKGVLQAIVELFNAVIGLASNSISFARLAAFGMVHAAIGELVWSATSGLWRDLWPVAALVFLVGNAVAFSLELLVAGVQALRLEYYELFSRIYQGEGRPFEPWQVQPAKEGA